MKRTPLKRGNSTLKRTPLKATSGLKQGGKLKQVSSKKKVVIDKKIAVYKIIDSTREMFCEGCGRTDVPLSHSHLIAESWNESLAAVEENIRLHCLDWEDGEGCHSIYEHAEKEKIEQMHDFEENLEIIKRLDNTFYNKLITRIYGQR